MPPPPVARKSNLQQLLPRRFEPSPPPEITVEECIEPPHQWVHRRFANLSTTSDFLKVESFDDDIYNVDVAGQMKELHHHEWIQILSEFRSR
jgi:hypothetical protein